MDVWGNVAAMKANGVASCTAIKSEKTPEQMIEETIAGGAKLLEKSLEALAQAKVVKSSKSLQQPQLSDEVLAKKAKLEEKGLDVTVRPDGKFAVQAQEGSSSWVSSADIKNVAVLKGDFEIYNDEPQSDVEFPNLESVEGNFTISGFADECRTIGSPNWGYACDVKFPNLKEITGNVDIQGSACYLDLNSLENVGGTVNIGASCQSDNEVYLNNVKSIGGDLNIQAGLVSSSPQIFGAVEGTMNAIPPKSHYTDGFGACLRIGEGTNAKYYEFTTEEGVIKKYTV